MPACAGADTLRVAFWNADLSRDGPGLLLRDILGGSDLQIAQVRSVIADLGADILVLGDIDFDAGPDALKALNAGLPRPYPYTIALRPNTGIPSGFDLDGNGHSDDARDAIGYGTFPGQGGMAILSRLPPSGEGRDFSAFLWRDLPGADLPPLPEGAEAVLRLSTSGHHETSLALPDGQTLRLLTWHGTTPAFDGPEDRNGRRNHHETAFWLRLLAGTLPFPAPQLPFIVIGQANADPEKGDGRPDAIRALLASDQLQDPLPGDTVDYGAGIGPLRVSYILPSRDLSVTDSGHLPASAASRHWPLWIEIAF